MSRDREYTAAQMVEAIEAEDGVVRDVAERLGCSRMTVYRYRDRYKTVADALDKQRTGLVYEMRDRLKDTARDEEVSDHVRYKAQLKLLEVFDEEIEWSDKQRLAGPDGDEQVTSVNLNVIHTDADDFEQERREVVGEPKGDGVPPQITNGSTSDE